MEDISCNGTTKFEISRLKFCKRCVPTSRWSRFSKKLRGKYCRGASTRPLTRGWISRARGFWVREQSAFFDVRVCHPNADSYKNLTPEQIYKLHENDKKRLYSSRVLEVERGTFTPLVFTTTGGMSNECQRYHSRLAELLAVKKHKSYASTIAWIRTRVSFAILRSALTCLRGKCQQCHAGSSDASCNKQPQHSKTCLRIRTEPNSTVFCIVWAWISSR